MLDNKQSQTKSTFIERLAARISSVNCNAIFQEPILHDGIKVIPVAKIRYGFGAGYGHKNPGDTGKGGGGGAVASPIGYIEIKNGKTVFKGIRAPASAPALIIVSCLAVSFLLPRIVKLFQR